MTHFISRNKEIRCLEHLSKTKANLVVIKGRRRIGKSRFVEEFAKNKKFIRFSGIPPEDTITAQMQYDTFVRQMSKELNLAYMTSDDWYNILCL